MKFGTTRHKPEGEWVQTTMTVGIAGVQHKMAEVRAFGKAVINAEARGMRYGVEVVPQPNNPHDRNAIEVIGFCNVKGVIGGTKTERWSIGFLPRDLAAELSRDLVSQGVPIAAELYSIYTSDDGYLDIKIIVLAPPGHGEKVRRKRAAAST